jgi:uncharacterized protein YkwD
MILVTNLSRQAIGWPLLTQSSTLDTIAQYRADEMCDGDISHAGFVPAVRLLDPNYITMGENIAKGFSSAQAIEAAFMNSPEHRDNILSILYNTIGVGMCGKVVVVEYGMQ